ncbi:MAG: HupE/UreJ family protein [Alphaproteobacteria bacterium]
MRKLTVFATTLLAATPALAHTGHDTASSFTAGLAHPFGGMDHVLAMVSVGLLACLMKGRALVLVPAAFVTMMVAGGAMGMAGVALPYTEFGIALSIVVIGGMVAFGGRTPALAALAAAGLFATFHGQAHGQEMAAGMSGLGYATGFVLATAMLHGIGIGSGIALSRLGEAWGTTLVRVSGGAVAVAGMAVLAAAS